MLLIKNIQFTKLLKADGRLKEFNFRKTTSEGNVIFNVDVTDDRGSRILFHMQKQGETWKIQPQQLPSWITNNESQLHELIEQETK